MENEDQNNLDVCEDDQLDQDIDGLDSDEEQENSPDSFTKWTETVDGVEVTHIEGLYKFYRQHLEDQSVEYKLQIDGKMDTFRVNGELFIKVLGQESRVIFRSKCKYVPDLKSDADEVCDLESLQQSEQLLSTIDLGGLYFDDVEVLLNGNVKLETSLPHDGLIFAIKLDPRDGRVFFENPDGQGIELLGGDFGNLDLVNMIFDSFQAQDSDADVQSRDGMVDVETFANPDSDPTDTTHSETLETPRVEDEGPMGCNTLLMQNPQGLTNLVVFILIMAAVCQSPDKLKEKLKNIPTAMMDQIFKRIMDLLNIDK